MTPSENDKRKLCLKIGQCLIQLHLCMARHNTMVEWMRSLENLGPEPNTPQITVALAQCRAAIKRERHAGEKWEHKMWEASYLFTARGYRHHGKLIRIGSLTW